MAKKALCVGINKYPFKLRDLRGCVNDANAWASLLRSRFAFPPSEVSLLVDEQATKQNIMKHLKRLVTGAKAGDVLVYTFAGHGTYIVDEDEDEEDQKDEAQCPYFETAENVINELILDDELRRLFDQVPNGVQVIVISDSCHSGSISLIPILGSEVRPRFLNPELLKIKGTQFYKAVKSKIKQKTLEKEMKVVQLSGCQDDEFAYDAWIGEDFFGVFSYHATQALQEQGGQELTYIELLQKVSNRIGDAYRQKPQMLGKHESLMRPVFSASKHE